MAKPIDRVAVVTNTDGSSYPPGALKVSVRIDVGHEVVGMPGLRPVSWLMEDFVELKISRAIRFVPCEAHLSVAERLGGVGSDDLFCLLPSIPFEVNFGAWALAQNKPVAAFLEGKKRHLSLAPVRLLANPVARLAVAQALRALADYGLLEA